MPRSRSRSPKRNDRRRSRSRERKHRSDRSDRLERSDRHRRSRSRSPAPRFRSRSPVPRRRSRSHSPRRRSPSPGSRRRSPGPRSKRSKERNPAPETPVVIEKPKIDESQLEGLSQEDRDMMSIMGFAGFDTTKGKKVAGNDIYTANIMRKRRYRQYMNRRGGFNRPLDFIA